MARTIDKITEIQKRIEFHKDRIDRLDAVASYLAKVGIFGDPSKPITIVEPGALAGDLLAALMIIKDIKNLKLEETTTND